MRLTGGIGSPADGRQPGPDGLPDPARDAQGHPLDKPGESIGFGAVGAHPPQPGWFAELTVERQAADPSSTRALNRRALSLRREWQVAESLSWVHTGRADVLHFRRPGGWSVITTFGNEPVVPDPGIEPALVSADAPAGVLPAGATAWLPPGGGDRPAPGAGDLCHNRRP